MRNSGTILIDREQNTISIVEETNGASVSVVDRYGEEFNNVLFFDSVEALDVFYKNCREYIAEVVEKMSTEE